MEEIEAWGGWGLHSSICRGCKPLLLWYYVCFNVWLKTAHTFVWFCMLENIFLHTDTHAHASKHTHTDADKYTLAQSNWLIQYVKKLNAEKRNVFDSLSLAPLSSSEKHGWNMCSLDYMFELNRSCDLNWSAFSPSSFCFFQTRVRLLCLFCCLQLCHVSYSVPCLRSGCLILKGTVHPNNE